MSTLIWLGGLLISVRLAGKYSVSYVFVAGRLVATSRRKYCRVWANTGWAVELRLDRDLDGRSDVNETSWARWLSSVTVPTSTATGTGGSSAASLLQNRQKWSLCSGGGRHRCPTRTRTRSMEKERKVRRRKEGQGQRSSGS